MAEQIGLLDIDIAVTLGLIVNEIISNSLKNSDTLGFQLIAILVDQLEGKLELKRDSGTEFIIKFAIPEKG